MGGDRRRTMSAPVIDQRVHDGNPHARLNRQATGDPGVLTVSVGGGPGSGKTSLIEATARRLMPEIRVGVIACDPSNRDADRLARTSEQLARVDIGDGSAAPDADQIRGALQRLDLTRLDV